MASLSSTPLLVFDGDCGFCAKSALWLTRRGDAHARAAHSLALSDQDAARTLVAAGWMVDGEFRAWGASAIAAALRHRGGASALLGLLLRLPVLRVICDMVYAWVARHRHQMPGATDQCRMDPSPPSTPWKKRALALVIAAQILVPALALTHPPSRFGFQMYSGLGGTEVKVRDAAGRRLTVDASLLATSLRADLPYSLTLPEFLCTRVAGATTVTVKDADDQRSVRC